MNELKEMVSIDTTYHAALNIVDEVDTAHGKVTITDKKLTIMLIDENGPSNEYGNTVFSVGVTITADNKVLEKTERGFKAASNPKVFGQNTVLSVYASVKDMQEAIQTCINSCIERIIEEYGQPFEALS
jgi:hypothetical protein